jgi:hypothetical protein
MKWYVAFILLIIGKNTFIFITGVFLSAKFVWTKRAKAPLCRNIDYIKNTKLYHFFLRLRSSSYVLES